MVRYRLSMDQPAAVAAHAWNTVAVPWAPLPAPARTRREGAGAGAGDDTNGSGAVPADPAAQDWDRVADYDYTQSGWNPYSESDDDDGESADEDQEEDSDGDDAVDRTLRTGDVVATQHGLLLWAFSTLRIYHEYIDATSESLALACATMTEADSGDGEGEAARQRTAQRNAAVRALVEGTDTLRQLMRAHEDFATSAETYYVDDYARVAAAGEEVLRSQTRSQGRPRRRGGKETPLAWPTVRAELQELGRCVQEGEWGRVWRDFLDGEATAALPRALSEDFEARGLVRPVRECFAPDAFFDRVCRCGTSTSAKPTAFALRRVEPADLALRAAAVGDTAPPAPIETPRRSRMGARIDTHLQRNACPRGR